MGNNGAGNTLTISNGGRVENSFGYVGTFVSSSNNVVTVTGTDSLWTNRDELFVGNSGAGNQMVISNGGTVSANSLTMGVNASSTNNAISMSDAASQLVVTNAGGTGTSDIRRGTFTQNGGTFRTDNLLLTNAAGSYAFNTGTAIVQNASISNGANFVVGGTDGTGGGAVYVAHTGTHNLQNDMIVGSNTVGNSLIVSNGGRVQNAAAYLGFQPAGSNNNVLVTGTDSQWTNRGDLRIGNTSVGNTMTISNGGRVDNGVGIISDNVSSSNNTVTVTGANSLWSNRNALFVGGSGAGNSLIISNGGRVENTFGNIGNNASSSNNVVQVAGVNSLWINWNDLRMGGSGAGNTLTISDGGRVVNNAGTIGDISASTSNVVLVTGANSLWTNRGLLSVGSSGAGNQMIVSNGGTVTATNLIMGVNASSSNNVMNLSGAASQLVVTNADGTGTSDIRRGTFTQNGGTFRTDNLLLTNAGNNYTFNTGTAIVQNASISNGTDFNIGGSSGGGAVYVAHTGTHNLENGMIVGNNTSANALIVSNGGRVDNEAGYIGLNITSSNNTALVTGSGSLWSNRSNLFVGYNGFSNTLTISNGGSVENGVVSIGFFASSSNNVVMVTGANSLWTNRGDLRMGSSGQGNTLTISDGGRVDNEIGYIGLNTSSSNNVVTVMGANSLWTNRGNFRVGHEGASNTLTIANGGQVVNNSGAIGNNSPSSNNVVLVTGSDSLWSNRFGLNVGNFGEGNTLTISNGGRVDNAAGNIGFFANSSNNTVVVTGTGSQWTNRADLTVGNNGASNALHIADSGAVFASNLTMGVNASSSNNVMSLSDDGSQLVVTNAGGTGTSDIRRGTFTQNGGTFRTDNLLLTNVAGSHVLNSGTAIVQNSTISNGVVFTVGNGTDAALFSGLAGGTNTFNNGVSVAAQGVLTADGTLTSGFIETLANGTVNVNGTLTGTTTLLTNNGTFNASNSFTVAGLEGTTGTLNLNGAGVTGIVSITGTSTYNGAIAGAGALTKEGTGVLNLGGNNTFTGPLNIINGGTVNANGGSAIGDTVAVTVAAGATLGLGASETIGSLEGAGNVTLGGNTLTAGGNDASTIFSGVMSGAGGYTKAGTGTNTLTGANLHTGDTTVNGGLLVINGSVAGDVTVNGLGTLGGSGTIGGNLLNNGTINPGNSPGILNITGNFIQGAGGTLIIEVAGTTLGQFDRLNITGTATLDGTLQVVPFGGFAGFEDGQSITIITAAGGVTGTFANVIDTGALGFVVTYQANDVTVLVQGKPYDQNPNLTPNQKAIAEVLQQVRYSDDVDWLQNIRPVLNGLSAEDLALAFSQMSPLFYQSLPQMNLSWMQSQFQNLRGRFDELRFGNQGGISTRNLSLFDARGERLVAGNSMMISDTGSPLYVPKASDWDKRVGMFLSGSGEFGGMDNQGALNGYDFTTAGVTLGIDYQFTPEIVVGAFGSYANSRTDEKRGLGKSDADSGRGGVYAGYFKKNTFLNVVAGGGYTAYETERPINIGPLSRTANASPEGQEAFTMIEAGHDFELGKLRLGPVGGFQYRYVNVDQFTESGAGALNLTVNQREMESIMSQLGVRASYELKLGRVILQPTVSARWQYEFGDTGKAVQARFGTLDSSVFNIQTTAPGRNSALVSAGLNAYLTETISVFGAYNLETDAADYTVHGVNAGFNWQF
ncbi:autotransporter domain-containing protein [Kamptonema cortianum]|nr:autotransporter domain-containing protein [Kamptonema cortianum]